MDILKSYKKNINKVIAVLYGLFFVLLFLYLTQAFLTIKITYGISNIEEDLTELTIESQLKLSKFQNMKNELIYNTDLTISNKIDNYFHTESYNIYSSNIKNNY